MHSCEYASVVTQPGQFGLPPGGHGAGRPENRVHARSKPPHQKCEGLDFPMKRARNRLSTRSDCRSICQHRCTASGSYDACARSSTNDVVSISSIGTGTILILMPSERRSDM